MDPRIRDHNMTSEQYTFAIARIKELQNPALQPLGLALDWELNDLMTQAAQYEEDHDKEAIAEAEASECHAFGYNPGGWPGDGSGEDDFADYNQNEADDYCNEG